MARTSAVVISGPVNAKHIGGVHVTTNSMQPSAISAYFENAMLQPDTLPSHTYVASGKTEVLRGPDTISRVIRRPSISIKRSISMLSRKSVTQIPELHQRTFAQQTDTSVTRTESTASRRPLRMQSSLSRLRQKVGLDKDLQPMIPVTKPSSPEPQPKAELEHVPSPIEKDYPPLQVKGSMPPNNTNPMSTSFDPTAPRLTTNASISSSTTGTQITALHRMPSLSLARAPSIPRKPSPAPAPVLVKKLPVRPKRADSGTAIDFKDLPVNQRPLGFKEILAVPAYADRMKMYAQAREYWAHADHGLVDWTKSASRPKMLTMTA